MQLCDHVGLLTTNVISCLCLQGSAWTCFKCTAFTTTHTLRPGWCLFLILPIYCTTVFFYSPSDSLQVVSCSVFFFWLFLMSCLNKEALLAAVASLSCFPVLVKNTSWVCRPLIVVCIEERSTSILKLEQTFTWEGRAVRGGYESGYLSLSSLNTFLLLF